MSEFLVPILVFAVPVLTVVSVALLTGRFLKGSCGGMSPDGSCPRCGKPAAEMADVAGMSARERGGSGTCS